MKGNASLPKCSWLSAVLTVEGLTEGLERLGHVKGQNYCSQLMDLTCFSIQTNWAATSRIL